MADVAFVISPGVGRLVDLAQALRTELERQGMPTSVHRSFPGVDPARLYVLVDPGRYLDAGGGAELPPPAILDRTLALTAQGAIGGPDAPIALLKRMGRVFDVAAGEIASLHRAGVEAHLLRPGHHPEWDPVDAARERDVDIAFVDVGDPRRIRLLAEAADHLARHRCAIHVLDNGVDGERRRAVLRRARVAVQLHSGRGDRLDWLQAMDAMHSGAVLVAEQSTDLGPLEAGRDLFVATADALPWVVDELLADPARLEETRHHATRRLREWLPFAVSIGVLRASLVEMLGRPLDRAGDEPTIPGTSDGDAGSEMSVIAELRRARSDLVDVRRSLAHLQASVAAAAVDPDRATVARNEAWERLDVPSLAVLLTIGADGDAAVATLDALLVHGEDAMELILVETGGLPAAVAAWIDAHPEVPIARIHSAPGLAAGRTAALSAVRAPSCLVLDAGVVPYPRCAQALTARLVLEGSAVVSGIRAVRPRGDARIEGGGRLVGRDGNDLAAPLLVPTAALVDAGGFVSQSLAEGVERDDVWSRLSLPRRHVAEILSVGADEG